jgi:hypothetical protein
VSDYAELEPAVQPAWMSGRWGSAFFRAVGLFKDGCAHAAKLAVKARLPTLAPDDALGHLLDTFALEPLVESVDATRRRLLAAWDLWTLAGTEDGVRLVLRAAGYPNAILQTRIAGRPWWYYRLVLRPPFPFASATVPYARWGRGWRWGDSTRFWSVVPHVERARLTALLRKWAPAHAFCFEIVFVLEEGRLWGDGWRWGDGTRWGGATVRWRF